MGGGVVLILIVIICILVTVGCTKRMKKFDTEHVNNKADSLKNHRTSESKTSTCTETYVLLFKLLPVMYIVGGIMQEQIYSHSFCRASFYIYFKLFSTISYSLVCDNSGPRICLNYGLIGSACSFSASSAILLYSLPLMLKEGAIMVTSSASTMPICHAI